jgi:hypothetical protein
VAGRDLIERFTSQRFVPKARTRRSHARSARSRSRTAWMAPSQALVRELLPGGAPAVVSDENTYDVPGRRAERAQGAVTSVVLERPQAPRRSMPGGRVP